MKVFIATFLSLIINIAKTASVEYCSTDFDCPDNEIFNPLNITGGTCGLFVPVDQNPNDDLADSALMCVESSWCGKERTIGDESIGTLMTFKIYCGAAAFWYNNMLWIIIVSSLVFLLIVGAICCCCITRKRGYS